MKDNRKTILCVDDDDFLQEIVISVLHGAGYRMLEASSGEDALSIIPEQMPDLVLCDISMPKMGGHEVLTKLRTDHPECADIPFIFLTGLSDREEMLEGMELGADDYLTKPVDREVLLTRVKTALRQMDRVKVLEEVRTDEARLQTLKVTMSTVHDIVNNFLQNLQLFRMEAEKSNAINEDYLRLFDSLIDDTTNKLKTVGELDEVVETETESGVTTLDYDSNSTGQ